MDLHFAPITDFQTANPDVDVQFSSLCERSWAVGKDKLFPKHINPQSWFFLDTDMIQSFQNEYDSILRQFDGFLVAHVASFAMIYEKYNKPIIMINTCRYDIPFCQSHNFDMLRKWNECIQRLHSKGLLTIVSNNLADQEYTRLGTGIKPLYNPSLGLYINQKYNPTSNKFLCYSGETPPHPLIAQATELPRVNNRFKWSDVMSYRGIIHYPYEVSTMSMFEHYTAECPLFFPTKEFWLKHTKLQSTSSYWGAYAPEHMKQLRDKPRPGPVWLRNFQQKKIATEEDVPIWLKPFRDINTWMDLSDIYHLFKSPNVHYYDSYEDLFRQLETFQYIPESRDTYIENVKQEWRRIIQNAFTSQFRLKYPPFLCYNRLPLLANVVYDWKYNDVATQHSYPWHDPLRENDIVFVKTEMIDLFFEKVRIDFPITLITAVSDLSPTEEQTRKILENPLITRWIGTNITASHPKIRKVPIGVGEPEREWGNYNLMVRLHNNRIPWSEKLNDVCVPYVGQTHPTRSLIQPTLPKLKYEDYMKEISKHKFVVCPRGNGIDTHRFCEALLMGCVPVVEHSGLDDMYERFPCLLVDSFTNIDTSSFVWDDSKYQTFLDTFWLKESFVSFMFDDRFISANQTAVPISSNTGQIELYKPLGTILAKYGADTRFNKYLEIGTWDGRGSTYCFYDGFKRRSDNPILESYEIASDRVQEAKTLWKSVPNIKVIHGRILKDDELPDIHEVQKLFPNMQRTWHAEDMERALACNYVCPSDPDVVLLDGGEYLTYYEYQSLKRLDSIRVIIMDDTKADKCRYIVDELNADPGWKCVAQLDTERNGWAVYERV